MDWKFIKILLVVAVVINITLNVIRSIREKNNKDKVKYHYKELFITMFKTAISSYIASYLLADMPINFARFVYTGIIIFSIFYIIDVIFKVIQKIRSKWIESK